MEHATRTEHVRVLVTGAGGITGVAVIRALRAASGVPASIVAADSEPLAAGQAFADQAVTVPRGDTGGFADALLACCLEYGVELVLPTLDAELSALARERELFAEHGIVVAVSDPAAVETLGDKWLAHAWFTAHEIATPETHRLEDDWSPQGPTILKPRRGCGSKGTLRLEDERDRVWARGRFEPGEYLLQRWVDGEEFTVDVLADQDGVVRSAVARRRTLTKAGVSYVGSTLDDAELTGGAGAMATRLGLRGPANLQCIRSKQGVLWIEGNPRFSGGLSLTVGAGVNGPAALVDWYRRGRSAPLQRAKSGVTMLRYWSEHHVGA